jgi:hypothetical protein
MVHYALFFSHRLRSAAEQPGESTMTTITTLESGAVKVEQSYFDGEQDTTMVRTFVRVGSYVYQVHANGSTSQICQGLQPRGFTLMAGDDLAATIRATLQ